MTDVQNRDMLAVLLRYDQVSNNK